MTEVQFLTGTEGFLFGTKSKMALEPPTSKSMNKRSCFHNKTVEAQC